MLALALVIFIIHSWWYGKLPRQLHCRGCNFEGNKPHRARKGSGCHFVEDLEDGDVKRVWKLGPWKFGGKVGRCSRAKVIV